MSEIDYPIVGHKEKSSICNHCKHDYTGEQMEIMCMDENNNCQMCHAALSGKFADGKSLMIGVDMVNHPPHYKDASGIECIEVTRKMQFCGGNCFKYLYRAGQKGSPIEDLEKARWYAVEAHSSSERVSYSAAQDIFKIADSRGREFIAQAMSELARERWARVILFISHEIAYLEGLAND